MTRNQLAYHANLETIRSNLAREAENKRSNVAKERETNRSNLAREAETHRSNKVQEGVAIANATTKGFENVTSGVKNIAKVLPFWN